jgi:hypothetical protein
MTELLWILALTTLADVRIPIGVAGLPALSAFGRDGSKMRCPLRHRAEVTSEETLGTATWRSGRLLLCAFQPVSS